jgi:hypothetical protein
LNSVTCVIILNFSKEENFLYFYSFVNYYSNRSKKNRKKEFLVSIQITETLFVFCFENYNKIYGKKIILVKYLKTYDRRT